MTSWLNKQRKQTLLDLSTAAGLKQDDDVRKDDLIDNLDSFLQQNATRLSGNTAFEPYYGTRRTPFKASAAPTSGDDGEVKSVVKARGRRVTKVKPETEDEGAASPSSSSRTPAGRPRRRSELLPASPADVAEDMELVTQRVVAGFNDLVSVSGVPETIAKLQESCSSLIAVHITTLALEVYGLQNAILPWKYAFNIASVHGPFGISTPRIAIKFLDLFQILTGSFWQVALTWSATSIFVPLLFAYFYNLSKRDVKRHGVATSKSRYGVDPLIFNIVKAVLTFYVYGQGQTFGLIDHRVPLAINAAMVGGYQGILIGSFVGILVSLYEAVLRK